MGKSEYGWNQIPIVITVANDIIIALSQELSLCFCMIATIPSTGIKTANDALKRKLKVKNNANRRRLLLSNAKTASNPKRFTIASVCPHTAELYHVSGLNSQIADNKTANLLLLVLWLL